MRTTLKKWFELAKHKDPDWLNTERFSIRRNSILGKELFFGYAADVPEQFLRRPVRLPSQERDYIILPIEYYEE